MSDTFESDFKAYQSAFTAHIRDPKKNARPKGVLAKRMRVYTEIVFNNIESSVAACFPVTQKVLGKRAWLKLVRGFFANHSAQSPMFRDIPKSFLDYLETRNDLPPYLQSLAHYEWVELAVAVADVVEDESRVDSEGDLLDGIPYLAPVLYLLSYDYPVQLISARFKPKEPLDTPVHLLIFRNRSDKVQFVHMNSITADLVRKLQQGSGTGSQVLSLLASEHKHIDAKTFMSYGAQIMSELRSQDILLGVTTNLVT